VKRVLKQNRAMPPEAQITERMPVWDALSEFFLDTELQPDDHERSLLIMQEHAIWAGDLREHQVRPRAIG
jgi:hypothetical protein